MKLDESNSLKQITHGKIDMKKLWIINTDKPKSSTLTFADTTEAQLDDVLKWLEKGNPSVSLTEICESSSMLQLVLERKRQDAKWRT